MLASDATRKLYSTSAPSIPKQIRSLLSINHVEQQTLLNGKALLLHLKDAFDGLQDSFFAGGVLSFIPPQQQVARYQSFETEEQSQQVIVKLSYRTIDGTTENTIGFPSQVYSSEETGKFHIRLKSDYRNSLFKKLTLTMNPDYKKLLEASEVSPFGHNAETVIDPTVRKASHIPADRITKIEGVDLDEIVESVRLKLFPHETEIEAKVRYPSLNAITV